MFTINISESIREIMKRNTLLSIFSLTLTTLVSCSSTGFLLATGLYTSGIFQTHTCLTLLFIIRYSFCTYDEKIRKIQNYILIDYKIKDVIDKLI
jgi:hypothetical protein